MHRKTQENRPTYDTEAEMLACSCNYQQVLLVYYQIYLCSLTRPQGPKKRVQPGPTYDPMKKKARGYAAGYIFGTFTTSTASVLFGAVPFQAKRAKLKKHFRESSPSIP
jgi:hypothetical protein